MPTRRIQRGPATGGPPVGFQNSSAFNEVYVDGLTDQLVVGSGIGVGVQTLQAANPVQALIAAFVEDPTTLTHTATFPIPAGAVLLDIGFLSTVLWTGGGTVVLTIGDANAANGWFLATNLKATDLLVGERLTAASAGNWGGLNGAYLTAAGRFGQQSVNQIGGYNPNAYSVIMVVTESAPSTAVGRSFGWVTYALANPIVPVKA
jgi:hypothetical protein